MVRQNKSSGGSAPPSSLNLNSYRRLRTASSSKLTTIQRMQPALGLCLACPAAGALAFARDHGAGAGPAANRGITLVVQWVVGDIVRDDKCPDVAVGPAQQGIDLYQVELGVPSDDVGLGPVGRLVAPDGGNPRVVASHRPAQGDDLAVVAALVRPRAIERSAMKSLILGHGRFGPDQL